MEDIRGKVVLAVGAHPDDLDFSCGGTVARWSKEGVKVYYLILTDGSKGSEDLQIDSRALIKLRYHEQETAAKVLGVKEVYFLDFPDGELENTAAVRKEIVKIIRKLKPEVVLCWDPTFYFSQQRMFVNHRDHRLSGEATVDSVFPFARNSRTFPELLEQGLEPHPVQTVLLFNFNQQDFFVDVSQTLDTKIKAIACHESQFDDFKPVEERVRQIARETGKKGGMENAEGFLEVIIR